MARVTARLRVTGCRAGIIGSAVAMLGVLLYSLAPQAPPPKPKAS